MSFSKLAVSVAALALLLVNGFVFAQTPTTFTYQGLLKDGSTPVTGSYDFMFNLYDNGGNLIAGPFYQDDLNVTQGLFTAYIDFLFVVFDGSVRFLEISLRDGSWSNSDRTPSSYTALAPKQPVTPSPQALTASALNGYGVNPIPPFVNSVLKWDGIQWSPSTDKDTTYAAGSGLILSSGLFHVDTSWLDMKYTKLFAPVSGDLSNTLPNPKVVGLQGTPIIVSGLMNGQVLKYNSGNWMNASDDNTTYTAGAGLTLTGTNFSVNSAYLSGMYVDETQNALGDVTGNFSGLQVARIRGVNVSETLPTDGQFLKYTGGVWTPSADNNTTYTAGTGLILSGTTFIVDTTWSDARYVNEGQANSVTDTMITNLSYGKLSGVPWIVSGTDIYSNTSGNVGIGISSPQTKLEVVGTIRAAKYEDRDNTSYYLDPSNTVYSALFNGRVGIGTISPATPLEVNGVVRAAKLEDRDNTAYYADPSNTGTSVNAAGTIAATTLSISGNATVSGKINKTKTDAGAVSDGASYKVCDFEGYNMDCGEVHFGNTGNNQWVDCWFIYSNGYIMGNYIKYDGTNTTTGHFRSSSSGVFLYTKTSSADSAGYLYWDATNFDVVLYEASAGNGYCEFWVFYRTNN